MYVIVRHDNVADKKTHTHVTYFLVLVFWGDVVVAVPVAVAVADEGAGSVWAEGTLWRRQCRSLQCTEL